MHRSEGMPIKAIVRKLGVSRNAVRRALAADGPPKYVRPPWGSVVDAVEPQIRALLGEWPTMPATVIAERIGWDRSLTVRKDRVRQLRPLFVPSDPASETTYAPGELAQCDLWFPPADVPLGAGQVGRPPVLVMVAGYSRRIGAVLLPSRQAPSPAGRSLAAARLLRCGSASAGLGQRLSSRLLSRWSPEADRRLRGLPGHAGHPGDLVPPARSGGQGAGRAGQRLPGDQLPAGRTFTGPADSQHPARGLAGQGQQPPAPGAGLRPIDRLEADRAAMLALPPVAPRTGWAAAARLPRDHYVRLDSNDYSVHPTAVGRLVEVRADLTTVTVTLGRQVVARPDLDRIGRYPYLSGEHLAAPDH